MDPEITPSCSLTYDMPTRPAREHRVVWKFPRAAETVAPLNKCMAESNKTPNGGEATNRLVSASHAIGTDEQMFGGQR